MFSKLRTGLSVGVWILTYFFVVPYSKLTGSVTVRYKDESFQQVDGPVIIVSTHKSIFDPWLLSSSLPFGVYKRLLPIRPFVSKKLSKQNRLGRFLKMIGVVQLVYAIYYVIPIPEVDSLEGKIHPLVKAVYNGHSIMMFPEGRIHFGDTVGEFKRGVIRLQKRTGVPILPCAIRFTRRGFFGYRAQVSFGRPEYLPDHLFDGVDDVDDYNSAREHLRQVMLELYNDLVNIPGTEIAEQKPT